MSQSDFATALRHAGEVLGEPNTANKRLVQKWEAGEHTYCRANYRRALQSVTRLSFDQLGFSGVAPAMVVSPSNVGGLLERTGYPLDERAASNGAAGERLRFALERPGQADAEMVGLLRASVSQLFDLERYRPSGALLPEVGRQIDDVATLLAGTRREGVRHELAVVGGQAAALAGWLAFDLDDAAGSHRYWDSALAAARYASDGPLLACVFGYMSYSSAERGDPASAWQLAHTAVAHAGTEPRARAWMAARAAEEAAALGDRHAAVAELELALKTGGDLRAPSAGDASPPWCRFFYNACLWAMAAHVYGRLRDFRAARDFADQALRALSGERVKSRAWVLAEVACAAARVGELDVAVECGHGAFDLVETLESRLAVYKLRSLGALLALHADSVAVRELLMRLTPHPA